jgi:hypothetical protein
MKNLLTAITFMLLCVGCLTQKAVYRCGLAPENFPKYGQDSKLIKFERIAIMDTITAVIEGEIVALIDQEPMVGGIIELSNEFYQYKETSNKAGEFTFYHISAGKYKLTVGYACFRTLVKDSLYLGSGDIAELKLGMGSIGQDDL